MISYKCTINGVQYVPFMLPYMYLYVPSNMIPYTQLYLQLCSICSSTDALCVPSMVPYNCMSDYIIRCMNALFWSTRQYTADVVIPDTAKFTRETLKTSSCSCPCSKHVCDHHQHGWAHTTKQDRHASTCWKPIHLFGYITSRCSHASSCSRPIPMFT